MLFPSLNQENPPFTKKDLNELKKNKAKYLEDLHKLIDLIDYNKDTINPILKFVELIKDKEYLKRMKKEKQYLEYLSEADSSFECVLILSNIYINITNRKIIR